AKSFDSVENECFFSKRGKNKSITSAWKPYLLDIAFQTYVVRNAFPAFHVTSSLMFADKSKAASIDGLNQRFLISKNNDGKGKVRVKEGTDENTVGDRILCNISVDEYVSFLLHEE